tara:strand:+ start:190 stop:333 length:144 start_codon:yes stop_codon:yes gene_type:complete
MKSLILRSISFLLPITAFAVRTKPEQFEKLENKLVWNIRNIEQKVDL